MTRARQRARRALRQAFVPAAVVLAAAGLVAAAPLHEHHHAGRNAEHDHGLPAARPFRYQPPPAGTYELPAIRRAPDLHARDVGSGETVRLADLRGRAVLLAFMYTACPDHTMCPLTIATMERVRRVVAERGLGDAARFLAVTIDPARDTAAVLRRYAELARADAPQWHFLRPEGEAAAGLLLAAWDHHPSRAPDGTIAHVLRTYLVDPDGMIRQIYLPSFLDPRVVANDLTTVLRERQARR